MEFLPVFYVLIIVCLLLIGGIAAITIYLAIYNRKINKRLAEGSPAVKKRTSPATVVVMVISIVLVLIIITTIVAAAVSIPAYVSYRESGQRIDYSCESFTDRNLTDSEYYYFADAYREGKVPNKSYTVESKTNGNFEYTLFRNEHNYYSVMSPAFVLFVRYVGESDYKGFAECMEFTSDYGGSVSTDYGKSSDYYCILGNADSSDFHFTLAMFKDYKTCEKNFEIDDNIDNSEKKFVIKNSDEVFELSITDINRE